MNLIEYFDRLLKQMKKFEIDISNFKVLNKINSGGFGSVYTVKDTTSSKLYAAKVINSSDSQSKKLINREISVMSRMNHPTIIKFYGYSLTDFDGKNNVTLFMELAKGSLEELLLKTQQGLAEKRYDNTSRQKILIGVARGMMYLHQHHAIHRDLKPGNILLDDNLEPHITDFGLAKFISSEETKNTISTGTYAYMAPEVIDNGNYNGKSDVYSFGILMYEVVTDSFPYPEFQQKKITPFRLNFKILNEDYRPKFTVPVKDKIRQLIENCWSKDPKDRPTFEEIFNRLSRNIEDSVYNVFDKDDSEYFLDDVDTDEIFLYLDKIENYNDDRPNIDLLEESYSRIRQLTIENDQMKHKMQDLESKTAEFISKVDRLTIENESMKQTIIQLNSKIEFLTMKNNQMENLSSIQIDKHEKDTNDVSIENKESNENKILNEVRLHIKICKADIIESSNPFILLILKSQCKNDFHNTSVMKNTNNPVWNEEFNFFTTDPNDILLIVMFNEYADSNSNLIDEIEYPINNLRVGDPLVQKEFQITYNNKNFARLYIEAQLFKTVKSDIKSFCTFAVTGRHFIKQKFYRCLTCNLIDENRLGVCESCAMNCHKGHDLRYATDLMCGFFCDCPKKCSCHSMSESKDLPCTSVENDGKKINQPMYYCSSCDEEKKSLIYQNCAMKFHHGHNIVYLGIVESCSCQNELVNVIQLDETEEEKEEADI